jgi:RND superfamily putative drug exporter
MAAASPSGDAAAMRSKPNTSLAGRAGSWSARNKKKAIFGWLAFVVIAFVLGGAVGTQNLDDDDTGAGQSAQAAEILRDAFPASGEEQVIVSSRDPAALKAAVADVQGTVERFSFVRVQPPATSQDGRSVLVPFELPGDDETAQEKQIVGILSAVEAAQKRHPGTQIGEFGSASAGKALSERFESTSRRPRRSRSRSRWRSSSSRSERSSRPACRSSSRSARSLRRWASSRCPRRSCPSTRASPR